MKTKEELNALKEEVETLNKKLAELTEDELEQVSGGFVPIPYHKLGSLNGELTIERGGKSYAKDLLDDVEPGQRSE